MNLIELFDSLSIPESDSKVFNAIVIPGYPEFRIAIDFEGNPVLLLSISKRITDISLKNIRLKHLKLEQNIECKVFEAGLNKLHFFTVITFTNLDYNLQSYSLEVSELLIKKIGNNPTQQIVVESLVNFIEIFKNLSNEPQKTIKGLWAELFLINNSSNPERLLEYWHNKPEEKFDFNAGLEIIEVKSSSVFERKHIFSSDQLNPPDGTQVLIASIFVKQNSHGKSILHIVNEISKKVNENIKLKEKLNYIVCKTMGNSLEQSFSSKFDDEIAKNSLKFYRHQDISKIEAVDISHNISELHYKSDLTNIQSVNIESISKKTPLYSSI